MAADVKKSRGSTPAEQQRTRAVQAARVAAAATGAPDLNREQRRAIERGLRRRGR